MSTAVRKLKVGIIGLGVGEAHIQGYQAHPECEVAALCDFDLKKLEAAQKNYPKMKCLSNASEILNNPSIDVVSIASYDQFHYEQIVQAIRLDKHIFVEKPLCLFEDQARDIRALLNQKPHLKISSNLVLRQSPRFLELKQNIAAGEMGEIYSAESDYCYGRLDKIVSGWRGTSDYYSIVLGGGIHVIDLLCWLLNDEVEEVTAYGNKMVTQRTSFKFNDFVTALLKFKRGVLAKASMNFGCVMPHFHGLKVFGTKATFVNGIESAEWFNSSDPLVKPRKIETAYPGIHKGTLLKNFIDSILSNREPLVSKDEIFKLLAVCFAIEKSVQTGKFEKVNYF